MLVLKTIELKVADYMTPAPITVGPEFAFQDAISLMAEKGIGNLIVKEDHSVRGLFTEREILQYIVYDKKIPDISIKDVVVRPFTRISLDLNLIDAAKIMISEKARLLVFDKKHLKGILTASDIVRGFRRSGGNPPLDKVMSKKIYKISYSDTIMDACKLMHKKRIGSVVVEKNKNPFGIFTERDLLVNVLNNEVELKGKVGGYCSTPLITTKVGIAGGDAAKMMAANKIKRLVLTKDNKISAIVTARDIVDAFQWSFTGENN
ncbi:MAG TPA: CBS domain-containing protein [Nitrosopumilaceae archaeon]|nr:CBS domain-containing protein [Nitrosopumilaceae archaeon]